jgi:sodium-dependent phosphate cotransporter
VVMALGLLYVFLVGITCLSSGVKVLGAGIMDSYFGATMNPFAGLLLGLLATTLVQSSSVTTAMIVGVVAAGHVPVSSAIPMIMGANIGTTVTNTIASLAHSTQSGEFKRAFAAATCHDFFNFLAVFTLLPLELITRYMMGAGIIEQAARWAASLTMGAQGATYKSPLKAAFKAGANTVKDGLSLIADNPKLLGTLLAFAGFLIILVSLTAIVKVMRSAVITQVEESIHKFLGSGGPIAMLVGMLVTIMVQSSSITTSILVPLAGAGLITLREVYPMTLGSNLGTTITALLAAFAIEGSTALAAREIALAHLIFNSLGILVWYTPKKARTVPLALAEWLAELSSESRKTAVLYVASGFYLLPALIFFMTEMF